MNRVSISKTDDPTGVATGTGSIGRTLVTEVGNVFLVLIGVLAIMAWYGWERVERWFEQGQGFLAGSPRTKARGQGGA